MSGSQTQFVVSDEDNLNAAIQAIDVDGTDAVCLDIVINGRQLMRALANRFRQDLRKAGMGSGCHAFEVALPAGCVGKVDVRRSTDHRIVPRTASAEFAAAA